MLPKVIMDKRCGLKNDATNKAIMKDALMEDPLAPIMLENTPVKQIIMCGAKRCQYNDELSCKSKYLVIREDGTCHNLIVLEDADRGW